MVGPVVRTSKKKVAITAATIALIAALLGIPYDEVYQTLVPFYANDYHVPAQGKGVVAGRPCDEITNLNVWWRYAYTPAVGDCPGVEDVPMFSQPHVLDRYEAGEIRLISDSDWIMGLNEPDNESWVAPWGTYVSPEDAVPIWERMEALFPDYKLVAPSTTPWGKKWIVEFRNAYVAKNDLPPRFDALACHCYIDAAYCKNEAKWWIDLANEWDVPEVWVTEFAAWATTSNPAPGLNYMNEMIGFYRSEPTITRWSWFIARDANWEKASYYLTLYWSDTRELTPLGEAYRGF